MAENDTPRSLMNSLAEDCCCIQGERIVLLAWPPIEMQVHKVEALVFKVLLPMLHWWPERAKRGVVGDTKDSAEINPGHCMLRNC